MDISMVLTKKYPNTSWMLIGESYSGLEWLDDSSKPSKAELEALWPEVQYEAAYKQVEVARQVAYQAEADPLFFKSQRGKASKDEWLAKVAEIDARYPYPEKPKGKK